jgi:hypothetical protein
MTDPTPAPRRTPAPSVSTGLVVWALGWFALFVLLALYLAGLGWFACAIKPEATGCDRVPLFKAASLVGTVTWVVLFVANLTLPLFRYGPNARRRLWSLAPPALTLGLLCVVRLG